MERTSGDSTVIRPSDDEEVSLGRSVGHLVGRSLGRSVTWSDIRTSTDIAIARSIAAVSFTRASSSNDGACARATRMRKRVSFRFVSRSFVRADER